MTEATQNILTQMLEIARRGENVYPFMFQPLMGRSNTVSATIRQARKQGLLVQAGLDGNGKPYYKMPELKATHSGTNTLN